MRVYMKRCSSRCRIVAALVLIFVVCVTKVTRYRHVREYHSAPGSRFLVNNVSCGPRTIPLTPINQTNLHDWRFRRRVSCPNIVVDGRQHRWRKKVVLSCDGTTPRLVELRTNSSQDIFQVKFGDTCLRSYLDLCCMDGGRVPNVAHYVWFNKIPMELYSFVSFISVARFMKPCLILFHGEFVPYGKYWDYFIAYFPNVIHVQRTRPTHVFGQLLSSPRHGGDVMRLQALQHYGGVYLDWDQVFLKPIDTLRQFDFTMGLESKRALANGMILSVRNATFLQHYYAGYRNYTGAWNYNSIQYPYKLSLEYPELIHVAGFKFFSPPYSLWRLYYEENYNWTESYAIHFYYIRTKLKQYSSIDSIRTLNATIGSVWRHVLFGNKELCEI